ncbi:MAG: glucose-6-phosphate isomerase [Microthrixaceae bacterium]
MLARLGPLAGAADEVAAELVEREAVRRLFAAEHTLWRDDPTELADRFGWIPVVAEEASGLDELHARCDALVADVDHVLVMGMGGSSLFPEVLAATFGHTGDRPQLHVLDTTDPAAIARIAAACPPERTLHLASSKSGSTIETRSHLEWAWARSGDPRRFAVVTDPGSDLAALALERGFAEVFENRADIGGRYSALSHFGIVPALLAGIDARAILEGATAALAECGPSVAPSQNPALVLAAALAGGVRAGRDKATFVLHPGVATLGLWLEQLIAESLGKDGTGVVPIVGEPLGASDVYGDDRLFLVDPAQLARLAPLAGAGHPGLAFPSGPDAASIGRVVVIAELATALTGAVLGVQPFDQPDVAAAKAATNKVLDEGTAIVGESSLAELLHQLRPGDHLAIQAFVDPNGPAAPILEAARLALRDRHRVATSLGYGPRFLHSTGQLHKGGPSAIVCAQVVSEDPADIDIPGRPLRFGELKQAQATGDLRTLQARGIRAARVPLTDLADRTDRSGVPR